MRHALLILAAAALATPCFAQAPPPATPAAASTLPTDEGLRAASCTVILGAMAGTLRPSNAAMADELDALSRRWRAKAQSLYSAQGKTAEMETQISLLGAPYTRGAGLPGGTFDKAAVCQNEGAALPAG